MNKYKISNLTKAQREKICSKLNFSERTFYRKAHAQINEKNGFEYFELLKISFLLKRPINELINNEAVHHLQLQ